MQANYTDNNTNEYRYQSENKGKIIKLPRVASIGSNQRNATQTNEYCSLFNAHFNSIVLPRSPFENYDRHAIYHIYHIEPKRCNSFAAKCPAFACCTLHCTLLLAKLSYTADGRFR